MGGTFVTARVPSFRLRWLCPLLPSLGPAPGPFLDCPRATPRPPFGVSCTALPSWGNSGTRPEGKLTMQKPNETLEQYEDRVANAVEHDVATGVEPWQDPETVAEGHDIVDNKDPSFLTRLNGAIDAGEVESAETALADKLGGDGGDI